MKPVTLAVQVVLALAIAVLYYLHFSDNKETAGVVQEQAGNVLPGELRVAFVNSDTILKYYDYFKVSRDQLEAKGKKMDSDFRNRAQSLQRDIATYQSTAGNLTIGQAKTIEEDLTKKQQNLRLYQESLAQELSLEENKLNQALYGRVTEFLRQYSEENGIHIVLKFDPSSDVLFGGKSLDITEAVIAGLNESYRQEKLPPADTAKAAKK